MRTDDVGPESVRGRWGRAGLGRLRLILLLGLLSPAAAAVAAEPPTNLV